jgi:cell wall-associated NlpC family hydrolase
MDTNSTLLRLPRGYRATGQKSEIAIPTEFLRLPDKVSPGRTAALTAVDYLTTPYVFGARSKIGIDCSGLTEISYMATGITIPRDARQQILMGQLVGTPWNWDNLQPGDLIFFVSDGGRVIHTGVSLGGLRYIHASPPEVQVNSLDPNDPLYSSTWHDHFAFARRMFIE